MRWAIVDANEAYSKETYGIVGSVIGGWLNWEIQQAGMEAVAPAQADVILLIHAGFIDWRESCTWALKRFNIEPRRSVRKCQPYIITGGQVDTAPHVALGIADALMVGESYRSIRELLKCQTLSEMRKAVKASRHAIEGAQVADLRPDPERPWLLAATPGPLARPDTFIDWGVPDVMADDKVVRVVGSKGYHLKCTFCATTYRQQYQARPPGDLMARVNALAKTKSRTQIISNDPLNLEGFRALQGKLDHASLTLMELMDDRNLAAVVAKRPKLIRVGVEGVSPRIRRAFAKPVENKPLLDRIVTLHQNKVNTRTFWISHAPFEDKSDWSSFLEFALSLIQGIDWGIHQFKVTAFQPNPPAPLYRWLSPFYSEIPTQGQVKQLFIGDGAKTRGTLIMGQYDSAHHWRKIASCYGIEAKALPKVDYTFDMAPSYEDWLRLPSELVQWPISAELRYKASGAYARKMAGALAA